MKKVLSVLFCSLLSAALLLAASAPIVISASSDAAITQLTINGSGFSPNSTTPTVVFGTTTLSLVSFTDTQIIAAIPANEPAGSYLLSVTETSTGSKTTTFGVTLGAVGLAGPQGPIGLQGPQGQIGVQGVSGPQGPTGPTGATGPQGSIGPQGVTGPAGQQGPTGPTAFRGIWDSSSSYQVGDMVLFGFISPKSAYLNITAGNTSDPGDDIADWILLATASPVQPSNSASGSFATFFVSSCQCQLPNFSGSSPSYSTNILGQSTPILVDYSNKFAAQPGPTPTSDIVVTKISVSLDVPLPSDTTVDFEAQAPGAGLNCTIPGGQSSCTFIGQRSTLYANSPGARLMFIQSNQNVVISAKWTLQ